MTDEERLLRLDDDREAAVSVHYPAGTPRTGVLLAHGAGGDKDEAGLVALAAGLATAGHLVLRANLPYRQAGRAVPPRADRAVPGLQGVLAAADDLLDSGLSWIVGGRSYGGRVASLAVAAGTRASGLVLCSYPLHPPGRPDELRVEHWPDIHAPCCFLQGTRDPYCDLGLLRANLHRLPHDPRLVVVDGGDHSLNARRPDGSRGAAQILTALAPTLADWIDGV